MSPRADHEYVVYRCYDKDDRLLYIGHAYDLEGRIDVHRSSWSNPASAYLALRMTRYEGEVVVGKAAAYAAERKAIWDEEPLLNIHHQKPEARARAQAFRDDFMRPPTEEERDMWMQRVNDIFLERVPGLRNLTGDVA